MAQINLLPWREQARQEKKIDFMITLGIFALLTLCLILMIHIYYKKIIHEENARVDFLQTALGQRQAIYTGLTNKNKQQEIIETDLKFLTGLRENSFNAIRMLSELIKIVPSSITFEKLTREGSEIILTGNAQSELQITLLMKELDKSEIFYDPVLTRISEIPGKTSISRIFELHIKQKKE